MIILDTTVLVCAVGGDHPLSAPARAIFSAVRDGRLRAHTTPEVIQEFAHVRARRRSREDAASLAEAFATSLAPLQLVTAQHLTGGLELWRAHPQLGAFDAVLATLALSMEAELISADEAFGSVSGLRWRPLQ